MIKGRAAEAILGSGDLTKINLTQELEARSQFLEEETTKSEHNMLQGNPNMTSALTPTCLAEPSAASSHAPD